jgi:hypothetical protein
MHFLVIFNKNFTTKKVPYKIALTGTTFGKKLINYTGTVPIFDLI